MITKRILICCCLLLSLSLTGRAEESPPVLKLTEKGKYNLSLYLEVLEDPSGSLTIQDVTSSRYADAFTSFSGVHPNLGVLGYPVWVRFTLANPGNEREMLLSYNYSVTDYVDFYELLPDGGLRHLRGREGGKGDDTAFSYRRIVFTTTVAEGSARDYYLRIYSPQSAMTIVMTLWDLKSFMHYERYALFFYGLVFGAVAFFSAYFFRLSYKLNEPAQFWFSMYLITFGLLALIRGGIFQNIFSFFPVFWFNFFDVAAIGCASFSGIRLLRIVLEINNSDNWVNRYLMVMEWVALAFIPLSYAPLAVSASTGFLVFAATPILTTVIAFLAWKRGVTNAKYFAFGWLATNAACIIEALRIVGIIPWYSWMYGAFNTALIWSLAFYTYTIGKRIYSYKYFSQQDSLTGLANRYMLEQYLSEEWNRNMRAGRPLSLMMIDVDRFKAYNDTKGHQKGDECLTLIADILKNHSSRAGDHAGRYGGEEFLLVLSETDAEAAVRLAEKIRTGVINLNIERDDTYGPVVTLSAGVASTVPVQEKDADWLLEQADRALYEAKNSGRNRVCFRSNHNSPSSKKL